MGEAFTIVDYVALPALFYGDKVVPFAGGWPKVTGYFERLEERRSLACVLDEVQPYFDMFPG